MAKISKIKPVSSRTIRIETEFTSAEYMKAYYFDQKSVEVREDDEVVFELQIVPNSETATCILGRYGISIPVKEVDDEKVVALCSFSQDIPEESVLAHCIRLQNYLDVIEERIKATIDEIKTASEKIEEV